MADNNLMPDPNAPTGTGPRESEMVKPGTDYRSVQRPTEMVQPRYIPKSGADEVANALSAALKGFQHSANDIAEPLYKQQGQLEGAAAGQEPGFTPKSGLAAITAYGQGYNQAGHVTYVASAQLAVDKALDDAQVANQHNPQGFAAAAQAISDNTLKNTPAAYQPEMIDRIGTQVQARANKIGEDTLRFHQDNDEAAYIESRPSRIQTAIKTASNLPADQATAVIQQEKANDEAMRQALVGSGKWTQARADAEGQQAGKAFELGIHQNWASNTVSNLLQGARDGDVGISDKGLATFLNDPSHSPEDKQLIAREYEEQREQFTKQQGQLHAKEVSDLTSILTQEPGQKEGRGAFGPQVEAQIDEMYKRGWITPGEMRSMHDASARNASKGIDDDNAVAAVDAALHGEGPKLDPKDPHVQKAADTYWKTQLALTGTQSGSDAYVQGATSFINKTNIVPKSVQSDIRVGLMSGNPDAAVKSAGLAERLRQANPQADIYEQDTRLTALSSLINENVHSGMDSATAYNMAIKHVDLPPDQEKIRAEQYKTDLKKQNEGNPDAANNAALQKSLDAALGTPHWYGNSSAPAAAPSATPAVQAEFGNLTREFYQETGNLPRAQALAGQQILKTWGVSKINGSSELVKWPIPDYQVQAVRSGMATTATAAGFTGDANTLRLEPTANTDRSQGRFWQLSQVDPKTGVTEPVLDRSNQPVYVDTRKANAPSASDAQDSTNTEDRIKLRDQRVQDQQAERDQAAADARRDQSAVPSLGK